MSEKSKNEIIFRNEQFAGDHVTHSHSLQHLWLRVSIVTQVKNLCSELLQLLLFEKSSDVYMILM